MVFSRVPCWRVVIVSPAKTGLTVATTLMDRRRSGGRIDKEDRLARSGRQVLPFTCSGSYLNKVASEGNDSDRK